MPTTNPLQDKRNRRARRRNRALDDVIPIDDERLIAWYGRISLDKEKLELGVDRQRDECDGLASDRGLTIDLYFSDNSISALRRLFRPDFEKLADAIRAGEVGTIIAYHPDRLTANPAELEELIKLLDAYDVAVVTVLDGLYDLTTATGRMRARVVGAVAAYERELKGERQASKHAEMARDGKRCGGPRPFGYIDSSCREVVPEDHADFAAGRLKVDPTIIAAERETLHEIVDKLLRGQSSRSICAELNERGAVTAKGCQWTNVNLRQRVMSPYIAGIRSYHGERLRDGEWKEIITVEQFDQVQAIMRQPSRRQRAPGEPYVLTGLMFTPDGQEMRTSFVGTTGRKHRGYHGPGVSVRETDIDAIVSAWLFAYVESRHDGQPKIDPTADRRIELDAERDALLTEKATLDDAHLADRVAYPLARVMKLSKPIDDRLAVIRAELAVMPSDDARIDEALTDPTTLRRRWTTPEDEGGMTRLEKREVARAFIRRVVVCPSTARGTWARLSRHPERVTVEPLA